MKSDDGRVMAWLIQFPFTWNASFHPSTADEQGQKRLIIRAQRYFCQFSGGSSGTSPLSAFPPRQAGLASRRNE
ncbi:MAG: hypothetical protein JHC76_02625 [Akkermansiaceae bacterium]|jgi:hypothetical protein|nr:hypothetical protein [Akkermansiaceae bacterium]MBJ7394913.1 hypothetical protein [Akkermansiaceae bacterium]